MSIWGEKIARQKLPLPKFFIIDVTTIKLKKKPLRGTFLGHFKSKWAQTWWEPWACHIKGPRICWTPNPKKKGAILAFRGYVDQKDPKKTVSGP